MCWNHIRFSWMRHTHRSTVQFNDATASSFLFTIDWAIGQFTCPCRRGSFYPYTICAVAKILSAFFIQMGRFMDTQVQYWTVCLLNGFIFWYFVSFRNVESATRETILIKKRDKHVKQAMQSSVFDMDFFALRILLLVCNAHHFNWFYLWASCTSVRAKKETWEAF